MLTVEFTPKLSGFYHLCALPGGEGKTPDATDQLLLGLTVEATACVFDAVDGSPCAQDACADATSEVCMQVIARASSYYSS